MPCTVTADNGEAEARWLLSAYDEVYARHEGAVAVPLAESGRELLRPASEGLGVTATPAASGCR